MYKQTMYAILISVLICSIGNAGSIEYNENKTTMYLIDNIDTTIKIRQEAPILSVWENNPQNIQCINSTCVRGWFKIYISEFDFTYIFNYEGISSIVQIISVKTDNNIFVDTYKRTLKIDGIIKSEYEIDINIFNKIFKPVEFSFNNEDSIIVFGSNEINDRLFFSNLDTVDQYNYINTSTSTTDRIKMHFYTICTTGESTRLAGLTGILYNALGNMPYPVNTLGKAIQNIIFLPLFLIQTVINFSVTFLKLLIFNWWYVLMLLEIMCIIPVLKYKSYSDLVSNYFRNHVIIILFVKDKIMMPLITLIITIIVTIRNMFRI